VTHEELLDLITQVQQQQSELQDVEVKSAHGGTPKRLFESLSSFSNRPGGGIILCGLDEKKHFELVGVGNAHRLQEEISDVAANEMEPALRPEFSVEIVDDEPMVVIEVPEIPFHKKPCYYKTAGLKKGSYIRVGNTDRKMTDYEIFGYVSAQMEPTFDAEPVKDATLDDLDKDKLDVFIDNLRKRRPLATYLRQSSEVALKKLRIVQGIDGVLHPTLAGLLIFGTYPQEFEPQLVITFLHYFGTTETEKTPSGARFLDNRKFEGTIPDMIEGAYNHVMASIRKSSLIEGLWRKDVPEYPEEAVREAIANAVAHRDYSHYVRGSYIQIRLFADRLEIQSPGGLHGNVSEDTLESNQSTRNSTLMRLMEDTQLEDGRYLVENRGSGIPTMIETMRDANLEPPQFQDKRTAFWVIFHNHTLMNPEAVAWLNRFADRPLNDHQRLTLLYLKVNKRITNSDYQRLNRVDSVTATRELKRLVQEGLIDQHGTRRWAFYQLSVPVEIKKLDVPKTEEDRILAYIQKHESINNPECRKLLGIGLHRASHLLKKMGNKGLLRKEGERRWRRYFLP